MPRLPFDVAEVTFTSIRAQGPGGQNVNKVANAVQLRFDVNASSLTDAVKARLLARADRRVGADGVVVIKAQGSRSLPANRADALARLAAIVDAAAAVPTPRRATAPTKGSVRRRLDAKRRQGALKTDRAARGTDG